MFKLSLQYILYKFKSKCPIILYLSICILSIEFIGSLPNISNSSIIFPMSSSFSLDVENCLLKLSEDSSLEDVDNLTFLALSLFDLWKIDHGGGTSSPKDSNFGFKISPLSNWIGINLLVVFFSSSSKSFLVCSFE